MRRTSTAPGAVGALLLPLGHEAALGRATAGAPRRDGRRAGGRGARSAAPTAEAGGRTPVQATWARSSSRRRWRSKRSIRCGGRPWGQVAGGGSPGRRRGGSRARRMRCMSTAAAPPDSPARQAPRPGARGRAARRRRPSSASITRARSSVASTTAAGAAPPRPRGGGWPPPRRRGIGGAGPRRGTRRSAPARLRQRGGQRLADVDSSASTPGTASRAWTASRISMPVPRATPSRRSSSQSTSRRRRSRPGAVRRSRLARAPQARRRGRAALRHHVEGRCGA